MIQKSDVHAAYRWILGREPESDEAVKVHMRHDDVSALRESFLSSSEFRALMPSLPAPHGLPITVPPLEIEVNAAAQVLAAMVAKTGEYWNSIGETAPHWSVLTSKQFLPENIKENRESFFETSKGDEEIILSGLARVGMKPSDFKSCAEFGCGVGRLTFRLASLFPSVTGVDISAPHLALAREYCNRLALTNVRFIQADAKALMPATEFDFWFSRIVLQHNPPPVSLEIIRRVFRALPKGGVAMFQVPVYCTGYSFKVHDYLASSMGKQMEMHCVPQGAILREAYSQGMQLLDLREDSRVISSRSDWLSNNFIFRKI